jgi:prostaglandin-endoperoxide synthase 2
MSSTGQNGGKSNESDGSNGSRHPSLTSSTDVGEKLASRAKPKPTLHKPKSLKPDREGVANAFEKYGQVIHATIQPLPNQGGAGTFSEDKKWGKLKADIKTLRAMGMQRIWTFGRELPKR